MVNTSCLLPVCVHSQFCCCVAADVWMSKAGVQAVELYAYDTLYGHRDDVMLVILIIHVFASVHICMVFHMKLLFFVNK